MLVSFFLLWCRLLPRRGVRIYGYARTKQTDDEFRETLFDHLNVGARANENGAVETFLSMCYYRSGTNYGDSEAMGKMNEEVTDWENSSNMDPEFHGNRLFYFAIPANVFAQATSAIKSDLTGFLGGSGDDPLGTGGWTRIIVEKPFGHDSESCTELTKSLSKNFDEPSLYRIDHYLGKEMVQNLMIMRFGNVWFERLWNRNDVASVVLTFKEPFGVEGRGGSSEYHVC